MTITSALFFGAAVITVYTYVGYPALIYLGSRLCPRAWLQETIAPSISIILAVHNGALILRQKIDHLLAVDYPQEKTQIIVVSDGSTDETNAILDKLCHPRVRCIIRDQHDGKAVALNAGMECATGEILVFVDIRPRLHTNALWQLLSNFADAQIGCVAGELVLFDNGHDAATKAVGNLYWRYEQWIRECESKVDSLLGVYGGFYAVRRNLAQLLPEGTILDDMLQPLNIIRQGYRSVLDTQAYVFDSWPNASRNEFARKVRTLAGNFQLLKIAPWIVTRQNRLRLELISHKLLRLLVPVLLVILFITNYRLAYSSRTYGAIFGLQLGFYFLAVLGFGRGIPAFRRFAGAANAFCVLNAAVVVGFYKLLFTREPLWKIWVTAAPQEQEQRDRETVEVAP